MIILQHDRAQVLKQQLLNSLEMHFGPIWIYTSVLVMMSVIKKFNSQVNLHISQVLFKTPINLPINGRQETLNKMKRLIHFYSFSFGVMKILDC